MSKRVNAECEPWVVASRLRDHLLSPKERKDPVIWKKVLSTKLIMPIIVYLSLWIDIASKIVFALELTCLNWL